MTLDEILNAFGQYSALVVGDVCLDRWCRYEPSFSEPSRETGIPRIAVTSIETTPGAAGTIASNMVALGARRVAVLGAVGDDGHGWELQRALSARGIEANLIGGAGLTFTYTKLLRVENGVEDLPRVDYVNAGDLSAEVERKVVERFRAIAPEFDVIVVSDQMELDHGGVVGAALREAVSEFARTHADRVVWVDSRMRAERFRNVLVKVNEREAAEACARLGVAVDYQLLRYKLSHPYLLVTRGEAGALVVGEQGTEEVPCFAVADPVDICGAGDAFNAAASLALRVTGDHAAAARVGNYGAGVAIGKPGTGTASRSEILTLAARA